MTPTRYKLPSSEPDRIKKQIEDGYISRMVSNFSGYGKALYLTLNDGNVAVYAHLEEFAFRLETILYSLKAKNNSYIVNEYFSPEQFPFKKGDIIFTGTPEGVGALESGDQIEMGFNNHPPKKLVVI